ncbi:MAG TPA: beta-ketoacyl synthase N-terminal-like domain-containing protein [Streptosporangiaceae bacterium]
MLITGLGAACALGRGTDALLAGILGGEPAFGPVTRFDTTRCKVKVAAQLPGSPALADELAAVIGEACGMAGLSRQERASCALLIALHSDPAAARDPGAGQVTGTTPATVAGRCGLAGVLRTYSTACVASSTAAADAAAMIAAGTVDRVVVAAGYLVEADSHGLFDAGRALSTDGWLRPFSAGRRGMLLGDGFAAAVLESASAARGRQATALATLAGWGRSGDAYDVCRPRPDGTGLAKAIGYALRRAGLRPGEVGYVNASGSGTPHGDSAEAAALHLAFGPTVTQLPVSSTKSVHGHALEASALLELVATVLVMRRGRLPSNAGFLGPDEDCQLDLVLGAPRWRQPRYALSLNAAFGGANTALLVGAR